MTRRVHLRIVLIASFFLLLSFAGIRPSAARSSLPYWTEIPQGGAIPDAIWDGASAYHQGLFYIFGGLNGTYPNDEPVADFSAFDVDTLTWYDLGQYPGGPSARAESMMWCVAEDDALIVSGGRGPFRRGLDLTHQDTFRFDPVHGWTQISQSAAQIGRANRSTEAVAVREKGKHKTVAYAFSGSSSTLPAFINRPDGLQHDLVRYKNGWKQVATGSPGPRARAHHPLVYAQGWNALLVYGGYTNDAVNGTGLFTPENYLGDLWMFDVGTETWDQLVFDEAGGPGHRDNAKLIADEHNDRIWLFGGSQFDGTTLSDLWYFDLHAGTWTRVDTAMTGPAPAPRFGQFYFSRKTATAYELYIFGGATAEFAPVLLNDMWRLTIPLACGG
ncbi:Kelch repeat-containing protein [Sorangium atrum]|uniref:Kelch repeat-containing protein n=1 Tax=Sorangium atrum TaxID=2995308 RepID=A0ABT5BS54_9BACT|nr:kelch repeat-containing protein [Sorangium aterium]MDC0676999.1 kelch repeat-containing protein [Sorangium aterium]